MDSNAVKLAYWLSVGCVFLIHSFISRDEFTVSYLAANKVPLMLNTKALCT